MPSQPSMRIQMKQALKAPGGDMLPNDMGIFDGTFVMPTGPRKPRLAKEFRDRLRLEWHRLKKRVTDMVTTWVYKWAVSKAPNPRPKLKVLRLPSIARRLHREMYTAFAEADQQTLTKICTDGLYTSFMGRISRRPRGERLKWTLHDYRGWPRVVSHRAVQLREIPQTGIRQVVVRIKSRQTLEKLDARGGAIAGDQSKPKDLEEYVVIQRRMLRGHEGDWMIWGTTQESDWKKALEKA